MVNREHISERDWLRLLSAREHNKEWMQLQSRLMMHINACPDCKALYDAAVEVRDAARDLRGASARSEREDGYEAVASGAPWERTAPVSAGSLSVCIDQGADAAYFLEDTMETFGAANRFAMNMEEDGSCLEDDGGELRLSLKDGQLLVVLTGGAKCRCRISIEGGGELQGEIAADGSDNCFSLPEDSFCTLELIFA